MRPVLKNVVFRALAAAGLSIFSSGALADDLDVTMRMVTDDESLTESVVREIELSRPIMLDARPGNATAKEARERGREFGQSVAERAKEAARIRKEGSFPDVTDDPDANPERPDNPGRSGSPGRPDNT
ncbi:hypothetical protein [Marinobacter sp. CHS3-4]|uniref:hypothetical protein n=1 Tax=Marinobacter sp. CHS3-4 TaxID=3045174 RepID=UPI0024B5B85D|nr:hypothetical protein [Marinobacter sp. CHS3-4]MDI9246598.1 hypothetical protein [Marinobacter sp. CHS3-4]